MTNKQLAWAQTNRRWRKRCEPLSALTARLPLERWTRQARRWAGILPVLKAELGAERFGRVAIVSLRRGVLTLETANDSEAEICRREHALRLADALQAAVPDAGIISVRFRVNRDEAQDNRSGRRPDKRDGTNRT